MHPLRKYREDNGLSQEGLGRKLGVSRQTVLRWENGHREIKTRKLNKVSEVTGIPPAMLRPDLVKLLGSR